ncbi:WhiB family transcriptional regulator [Streptomyces sp. NPDC051561]|uniref:WhiB family transcriptional regulator n=1 Tax=Streptomyces sp. NPDC051561 TaxID=3365658 RepID=UPI0037B1B95D
MRTITTHANPTTGLRGVNEHHWRKRAACYGMDAKLADALFFPTPRDLRAIDQARAICGPCPVRQACFDAAMDSGSSHGIWAGLTEHERASWHEKTRARLDDNRVHAFLDGRAVALSPKERKAVVRIACQRGWDAERIGYLLGHNLEYTQKLMRVAEDEIARAKNATDTPPEAAANFNDAPRDQERPAGLRNFGTAA